MALVVSHPVKVGLVVTFVKHRLVPGGGVRFLTDFCHRLREMTHQVLLYSALRHELGHLQSPLRVFLGLRSVIATCGLHLPIKLILIVDLRDLANDSSVSLHLVDVGRQVVALALVLSNRTAWVDLWELLGVVYN